MKIKLMAGMSLVMALTSVTAVAAVDPARPDRAGQEVVACDNTIYNCCWQRGTENTAGWYPFTGSADGLVLCPDGVDSYTDCKVEGISNGVGTKSSPFYINPHGSWKKGPTPSACGTVYEPKSGVKSSGSL